MSQWSHARVHAGGGVVRYARAGSGRPVVVLSSDRDRGHVAPEVVERLVERFRVIAPEADDLGGDVPLRLRSFLEGLGAPGAGMVAAGRFREAAREMARLDTGHVARVVLVGEGGPADDDLEARSGRPDTPRPSVPLLVVRGRAGSEVAPLVIAFLKDGGAPTPAS